MVLHCYAVYLFTIPRQFQRDKHDDNQQPLRPGFVNLDRHIYSPVKEIIDIPINSTSDHVVVLDIDYRVITLYTNGEMVRHPDNKQYDYTKIVPSAIITPKNIHYIGQASTRGQFILDRVHTTRNGVPIIDLPTNGLIVRDVIRVNGRYYIITEDNELRCYPFTEVIKLNIKPIGFIRVSWVTTILMAYNQGRIYNYHPSPIPLS